MANPSWSPDGLTLAFLAASGKASPSPDLTRGVEVDENWNPTRAPEERTTLQSQPKVGIAIYRLDALTGQVQQLTSSDQRVASYAWAPDGSRIAYSAAPSSAGFNAEVEGDIYAVDLRTRAIVAVAVQPGGDGRPAWSPDGQWLSFPSQRGVQNYRFGFSLAIAPSDGSAAPFYPTERYEKSRSLAPSSIRWNSNGKSLLFSATSEMREQLFEVDRQGTNLRTTLGGRRLEHAGQFTFNDDMTVAVFVRQSPTQPTELWALNVRSGGVQQITRFNSRPPEHAVPSAQEATWDSFDGKWKIHGITLMPPAYSPRKRYPLLVYLEGGPAQVTADFSTWGQYPLLTFAARGYVVLIPNTRGRDGYGREFDGAIETERSFTESPYKDVMAGVESLIAQGVAAPEQLGIAGFSYGATLSAYIITQTSRFKCASLGDGSIEKTTDVLKEGSLPWVSLLMKHQEGVGDLYEQGERIRYENQLALAHIQDVRTPTLILNGIDSLAATQGRMFLHAFRRARTPAELIVYPRTGHGIREPKLLLDSHERNLEWFDYWVRGVSSPRMAARYGASYKPL